MHTLFVFQNWPAQNTEMSFHYTYSDTARLKGDLLTFLSRKCMLNFVSKSSPYLVTFRLCGFAEQYSVACGQNDGYDSYKKRYSGCAMYVRVHDNLARNSLELEQWDCRPLETHSY